MKKQLDLGCGNIPRQQDGYDKVYGVDVVSNVENVKIADLALEPIPFEDDSFDLVTAFDFMEHIPYQIYIKNKRRSPQIELFNEIYRVLKDGGEFYMQSPCYPHIAAFQDPTHVYYWTTESANYFSGDYYGMHDHYGHTSRFEKISQEMTNGGMHIAIRLKAIKSFPANYPYLIHYS